MTQLFGPKPRQPEVADPVVYTPDGDELLPALVLGPATRNAVGTGPANLLAFDSDGEAEPHLGVPFSSTPGPNTWRWRKAEDVNILDLDPPAALAGDAPRPDRNAQRVSIAYATLTGLLRSGATLPRVMEVIDRLAKTIAPDWKYSEDERARMRTLLIEAPPYDAHVAYLIHTMKSVAGELRQYERHNALQAIVEAYSRLETASDAWGGMPKDPPMLEATYEGKRHITSSRTDERGIRTYTLLDDPGAPSAVGWCAEALPDMIGGGAAGHLTENDALRALAGALAAQARAGQRYVRRLHDMINRTHDELEKARATWQPEAGSPKADAALAATLGDILGKLALDEQEPTEAP